MADKYATRPAETLSTQERAANILGCVLDKPTARLCAAELAAVGLPSTDRVQAIAILHGYMSRVRAVACANDLAMHDLVPRDRGRY